MHFICELVIPPTTDVESSVAEAMRQFLPEDEDEESRAGWLDYYVIGGRWTGNKLKARFPEERMGAFVEELQRRKVTVSGLRFGKQELSPASQIPEVDALWREWFPDCGEHCVLFKHSGEGGSQHDVCRVDQLPTSLSAERLIVAKPSSFDGKLRPERMLAQEHWNGVEHEKTEFDGNVAKAINAIRTEARDYRRVEIGDDWLVVTLDYHN